METTVEPAEVRVAPGALGSDAPLENRARDKDGALHDSLVSAIQVRTDVDHQRETHPTSPIHGASEFPAPTGLKQDHSGAGRPAGQRRVARPAGQHVGLTDRQAPGARRAIAVPQRVHRCWIDARKAT